jgi:CheY-like chemotaxis protein
MSMSRRTVLIVDDESAQRALMRGMLLGEAYGVLEASDIPEALAVQESHLGDIDLALIDLILPGGSGYELSTALLAREPHMKALFMSGQAGAELRKFLDERVPEMHFLRKPFQAAELLERVKAILESSDPFADAAAKS